MLHTDPSPLGGNRCVRGYFGLPCAHCTSALHIVLVHTQGSFVSKILTPHASPVGFYRLCQGFSQQWICKERKGDELPFLNICKEEDEELLILKICKEEDD